MNQYYANTLDTSQLWNRVSAQTRSVCAENFTGEKEQGGRALAGTGASAARDLGQGWKISPFLHIEVGETATLADIAGPGAIQSIWIHGPDGKGRNSILRIYWDGQEIPSVECPLNDFFAKGYDGYAQLSSIPIAVNPRSGMNSYWVMPFRQRCRITFENRCDEALTVPYQINYTLTDIPDNAAYFHAQFRRVNPLPYKTDYTIVDGIKGAGKYVGTYMAVGVTNNNWWGEGEIKFFLDGDKDYPTICGTGTEDYFGGSYDWDVNGRYTTYTTPYLGMHQVVQSDGTYQSQQRFAMYRWHIPDPIHFEQDLRVVIQALGWRSGHRYLPLQCDIASVAYWYQTLPTAPFPSLPDKDYLEII